MQDAIKKTVDYWASVAFSDKQNWNNGSPEEGGGGMMAILSNMNALGARSKVTDGQREKFKKVLAEKLEAADCKSLHVDYHPDEMLAAAADEVGIPHSCFPCKTTTQIRNGVAYGKCGYGKEMVKL